MNGRPWRETADGLIATIRAVPRASRTEIAGIETDPKGRPVLKLRIAAPPVDGAANRAVTQWLAKTLGAPKRDVTIVSGETGRTKQVEIRGDAGVLAERFEAHLI
ncbi:MAG: DUF167 family protein [Parasphingopyxis sp.]|uniref:DUF167 domain-containing protein n=1 Tax=Parasphingopyxis sp. TaxID=1920299 RepID=UPI0032EF88A1